ncbi:MAG: phosphatidate cytidylyltransferase [Dehalococcoidia bacterium]|nr:phosphatidate cytidylyltransferase [Dehalococcoidia bacterium]
MLTQRLLVAAVGLPILALLLLAPERWFSAAVTIILAAGTAEFVLASPGAMSRTRALAAAVSTAVIVSVIRSIPGVQDWTLVALLIATALTLGLLLGLRNPDRVDEGGAPAGLWWLGSVLYLGVLGAHWLLLRALPYGSMWVLVMLAATFAADTGAYTTGRLIGRHRLWPAVSPNKTWEGFAGGMLCGGIVVVALPLALGIAAGPMWWIWLALLAVGAPLLAIAGDFLESALKRRMGVKDMSSLLPGHGGLLDRLDSLLLAGPLLYWVVQWATP